MIKIIFVCLGNICRSPIAESTFKNIVDSRNLGSFFEIESAGTAGYHIGENPDRRAIQVLMNHNIETKHLGNKLDKNDLEYYDHIVVMDESNFEFVHDFYHKTFKKPPSANKLFLIRDHDPEVKGVHSVPDPYYDTIKEFEEVYQMLFRSNEKLLDHLIDIHNIEITED